MPSGDGNRLIRNAPYHLTFPALDAAGATVSGIAASMAAVVSLDGGTFTTVTAAAAELASTGIYTISSTAAEMTGDEVALRITQASMRDFFKLFEFEPALDSGVVTGVASSTLTLRTGASATNNYYNGATLEIARGPGAGQTRSIIAYVGSSKIATIDRAWVTNPDTSSVYQITAAIAPKLTADIRVAADIEAISSDTTAADNLEALHEGLVLGTISDLSPSTTAFTGDSALNATNDYYNKALLTFRAGPNSGITRKITAYVGSSKTFTLERALPATPTNGDAFHIISDSP